jgi:hypothetical protein
VLNSDDVNSSGNGNNSSSKLGMHIKSEEQAIDPLAAAENNLSNNNFNSASSQNRSLISQNSPDRIQPLPSNVVNKQSNSMDVRKLLTFWVHFFSTLFYSICSNKVRYLCFQRL